jgi:agarase
VVGEFHFGAVDRGVFDIGLIGVADQASRAKAYQNYVRSVLALPKFIGAHWFQYTDQPTTGRPSDGENGNVGFVSLTDTPYPELIHAAREVHGDMYEKRFGD